MTCGISAGGGPDLVDVSIELHSFSSVDGVTARVSRG